MGREKRHWSPPPPLVFQEGKQQGKRVPLRSGNNIGESGKEHAREHKEEDGCRGHQQHVPTSTVHILHTMYVHRPFFPFFSLSQCLHLHSQSQSQSPSPSPLDNNNNDDDDGLSSSLPPLILVIFSDRSRLLHPPLPFPPSLDKYAILVPPGRVRQGVRRSLAPQTHFRRNS